MQRLGVFRWNVQKLQTRLSFRRPTNDGEGLNANNGFRGVKMKNQLLSDPERNWGRELASLEGNVEEPPFPTFVRGGSKCRPEQDDISCVFPSFHVPPRQMVQSEKRPNELTSVGTTIIP